MVHIKTVPVGRVVARGSGSMFPFLSLEAAMDKWKRITSSSATTASSSTATSSRPSASVSLPQSHVKERTLDDRFRLPSWPSCATSAPSGTDSEDVLAARAAVRAQVDACLSNDLADSTLKSYQQVLASTVTAAEMALNKPLLPLEHDDDVLELFGFLRLRDGDGLHWSKVRTLRAALTKYHERLGVLSPFDEW